MQESKCRGIPPGSIQVDNGDELEGSLIPADPYFRAQYILFKDRDCFLIPDDTLFWDFIKSLQEKKAFDILHYLGYYKGRK